MLLHSLKEIQFFCSLFVHTGCFGNFGDSTFQDLNIRKDQFQIDRLNVSERINASVYMNDIRIFKTAYNMYDRVYLTNVCQELVSKSLTFGSALYKSGDINEFDHCRCYFL